MTEQIVTTALGKLRGVQGDGATAYLGVRYAQAPVGALRFHAPEPVEPWLGVFDATSFGPIPSQPDFGLGSYVPGDPVEQSEDCLTLNIWVPEPAPTDAPVMVFLHGGSFLTGSGAGVMYRGESLARRGVIVVTLNYRLGALGFLAHRDLGSSDGLFANFGLADQVAALRFVRDHIASFGGDPHKVTCFGQSAGAMSIADLFAAPSARGLFQRAVLQSGAEVVDDLAQGETLARRFARALGWKELDREALTEVPVEDLLAAQVAAASGHDGLLSFKPVLDGVLLSQHPSAAIASGASSGVELMLGTTRDEFKFFTFSARELADLDEQRLEKIVERHANLGGPRQAFTANDVIDRYRQTRSQRSASTGPRDLLDAIATDALFRVPIDRLAQSHTRNGGRCFSYRFDWPSPFGEGALGACHGLELPFVFGTLDNPVIAMFSGATAAAKALSAVLQESWVAFARCGNPSTPSVGDWPVFDEDHRMTMVFSETPALVREPDELERQFLDVHLPRYGEDGRDVERAAPTSHAGT